MQIKMHCGPLIFDHYSSARSSSTSEAIWTEHEGMVSYEPGKRSFDLFQDKSFLPGYKYLSFFLQAYRVDSWLRLPFFPNYFLLV